MKRFFLSECGRTATQRASRARATRRTWMQGALRPQAATVPPVVRAGRAARNSPERMGAATGHPGKGRGGQVSAVGASCYRRGSSRLTGQHRGLCCHSNPWRPFTQDKPVLGQKMPPSILTHISSTQKKTLFCVLDSAFILYPSVCPFPQPVICLSIGPVVSPVHPISHSFRDHWLMCLSVRLCCSS